MVKIKASVGQKGQVVIPKVLREEYGIYKNSQITLEDTAEGILLQRPYRDIAAEFLKLAQANPHPKKSIKIHTIEEEYDERMRQSGIV